MDSKKTRQAAKTTKAPATRSQKQAEVPQTPPSQKFSEFDPRSPTVDRTPLAAPANNTLVDPRSPTAQRTPIQARPAAAAFVDPRSPLPSDMGVERTPLAVNNQKRTTRGRGSVKQKIAFDKVDTNKAAETL